jgi:hypothetical protein
MVNTENEAERVLWEDFNQNIRKKDSFMGKKEDPALQRFRQLNHVSWAKSENDINEIILAYSHGCREDQGDGRRHSPQGG